MSTNTFIQRMIPIKYLYPHDPTPFLCEKGELQITNFTRKASDVAHPSEPWSARSALMNFVEEISSQLKSIIKEK